MEHYKGINQRIPADTIEKAMRAALDEKLTPEMVTDLASEVFLGVNRIKKAEGEIRRITVLNPLLDFVRENRVEIFDAMAFPSDRAIIITALINSAYHYAYLVTNVLGKYFHVQEQISSNLIVSRMSDSYGTNKSLTNSLYYVLPMYVDAGLIKRAKVGVYERVAETPKSDIAKKIYRKSFFLNNPMLDEDDSYEDPYFEFI